MNGGKRTGAKKRTVVDARRWGAIVGALGLLYGCSDQGSPDPDVIAEVKEPLYESLRFQYGRYPDSSYTGVKDTEIRQTAPETNYAESENRSNATRSDGDLDRPSL